jgi:hypothetical protein
VIDVLAMALLALPKPVRAGPILVRADTVGATHAFINDLVGRKLLFSIGFPLEPDVKAAILAIAAPTPGGDNGGWVPALDSQGRRRRGAWVAELSALDLAGQGWPQGTRPRQTTWRIRRRLSLDRLVLVFDNEPVPAAA